MKLSKQELFEKIAKKCTVKKEDLEEKYDKFFSLGKKNNLVEEDKLDNFALAQVYSFYKRQLASPAFKFQGHVLAVSCKMDFGSQRQYDEVKKKFESADKVERGKIIEDKRVDEEGNPLWIDRNRKGQLIKPEEDLQKHLYCVVKKEGDSEYKKAIVRLRSKSLDKQVPLLKLVEFRVNGKYVEEEDMYSLGSASVTEFKVLDDKKIDMKEYLKTYWKSYLVSSFAQLRALGEKPENKNKVFVLKGIASNINLTSRTKVINLVDDTMDFDDQEGVVGCFVPPDIEIDFPEGAPLIIFGKIRVSPEKVVINVLALEADEKWKNLEKPKPVVPLTEEVENKWD